LAYVALTSSIDRRRRWVNEFARSIDTVSNMLEGKPLPAGVNLEHAVTFLDHLPSEQQPELHERLRDAADNLDAPGMGQMLGELRAALPPADAARLGEDYSQFVKLCSALTQLIEQHNYCQSIDWALREADGLPGATAGMLSQWSETQGWIRSLAESRADDVPARRLREAAERFAAADAATAAAAFARIRERFKGVFFDIDAQLLDTTEQVIRTAGILDALLWRFMS
jgi:hypothetical protein